MAEFILDIGYLRNALLALAVILGGIVLARIFSRIVETWNKKVEFTSQKSIQRVLRFFRVGIFLLSLVIALGILEVEFARELGIKTLNFLPNLLVLVLLWLLGYAIISLVVDFLAYLLLEYAQEYLKEFDISHKTIKMVFFITKVFLLLILATVSLEIVDISLFVVDTIIMGLVIGFIGFIMLVAAYAFKDYVANFFLSAHVAKNIMRPGQYVRINDRIGEVLTVTNHGTIINFQDGYKMIVPNAQVMKRDFMLKRTRSDLHKMEAIVSKYLVQRPSLCGPASAAMLLRFFGYDISQEQIAKRAKSKVRGKKETEKGKEESAYYGTDPAKLIDAVKTVTKGEVKGHLVRYDELTNLRDEVKTWLTEGGLVVLWYKKPILFQDNQFKSGHYVLGVGVEGDEVIVMDPGRKTAGVYLINYEALEEAMADHDEAMGHGVRGYIVFAKKGSPAYWRLTEGLYYSDTSAYEEISKSFERHLKRAVRKSRMVQDFVSPLVEMLYKPDEDIKQVWKPDINKK